MDKIRKNISLDKKNWERLRSYGTYGDSFDSILERLMDRVDKVKERK